MIQLSERLSLIASFVPKGAKVADIGSDHALLPSYLIKNNISPFTIAGEVNDGPLLAASKQIIAQGLEEKVSVRKGNGLEVIDHPGEVNVITIAGMGGSLITNILQSGKDNKNILKHIERLILQPNVGDEIVRKWLDNNNWNIIDEEIIEEEQKIYPLIVAEPRQKDNDIDPVYMNSTREKDELYKLGPILWEKKSKVLKKRWQLELKKNDYIRSQLLKARQNNEEKIQSLIEEREWIKEVIKCL